MSDQKQQNHINPLVGKPCWKSSSKDGPGKQEREEKREKRDAESKKKGRVTVRKTLLGGKSGKTEDKGCEEKEVDQQKKKEGWGEPCCS